MMHRGVDTSIQGDATGAGRPHFGTSDGASDFSGTDDRRPSMDIATRATAAVSSGTAKGGLNGPEGGHSPMLRVVVDGGQQTKVSSGSAGNDSPLAASETGSHGMEAAAQGTASSDEQT